MYLFLRKLTRKYELLCYNISMETKYQQFFFDLRGKMLSGILSYDEARKAADPIINEMNEKAAQVAKKYKKHAIKFNFANLTR